MQVLKALPKYRAGRTPFRGWLFRIARNTAINFGKRRRPAAAIDQLPPDTQPAIHIDSDGRLERLELLNALLSDLDLEARELLALRYGADLSCREIASVTRKSEAAVRMRISRIVRSLKEKYDHDNL